MIDKNEVILIEDDKKHCYIENLIKEKENLKQIIIFHENNPKFANLENENNNQKNEILSKNNNISAIQVKIHEMNLSHEELIQKIDTYYEENSTLKEEIEKKNFLIEELITKIESLRLEFDNKISDSKTVKIFLSTKIGTRLFDQS